MTNSYGAADLNLGITRALASRIALSSADDLPEEVVHAGRRGILDWLGCAIAGSRHPTTTKLFDTLAILESKPAATVVNRQSKFGLIEAALVNGQMGHVLDFDDTHMAGVVLHTSSPVLAACFAMAEQRPLEGRRLLLSYAMGFEAGIRIGQAAPNHRPCGWHLTGTLGTFAAAAAVGRMIELDPQQLTFALGIAGTQAAGMQQNRGTSCKSFHAGRAASNGLLAALLAERGFDSSEEIVEGRRGFARIYSDVSRPEVVLEDMETRWEITRNGYKPYACGVLLHAVIDAVIRLRNESGLPPEAVDAIELVVAPNAVRITGLAGPKSGLQSKFSLGHTSAAAYIDGAAGLEQFSDQRARSADVVLLGKKISWVVDEGMKEESARARLIGGGRSCEVRVEHATGTIGNPMSDEHLKAKFRQNAEPLLGGPRAHEIIEKVWSIDRLNDVREIMRLVA